MWEGRLKLTMLKALETFEAELEGEGKLFQMNSRGRQMAV